MESWWVYSSASILDHVGGIAKAPFWGVGSCFESAGFQVSYKVITEQVSKPMEQLLVSSFCKRKDPVWYEIPQSIFCIKNYSLWGIRPWNANCLYYLGVAIGRQQTKSQEAKVMLKMNIFC